ncbi:MAG: DNA primase, partial [Gammaproteobacteria bacterium]
MSDAISQFREAMRAAGLEPPEVLEPGKLHRFPGIGKHNGNTAGWCKLFDDGLGGSFGDWSSGFSENWQTKRDRPFSAMEREAFKRHVAEAQAQAEAERKARQVEAAAKAAAIWNAAAPAPGVHPYLVRKGIEAQGARLHNGALLIPMRESGELRSLQFIGPDGDKRFLTGGHVARCYFSIGSTHGAAALCIAEG